MSTFGQNCKVAWAVTCAIGDFVGKFIRHGQSLLLYPGATSFSEIAQEIISPDVFSLPYELVPLSCSDGVKVEGCLILNPRTNATTTVLLFHGNGANYSMQLPMARAFWNMGCHCFLLSYRGFGNCAGSPTEKGLKRDAAAAMEFISSHPILSATALVFYGQSLGGAVAIDTASRFPDKVAGLVLENTFLSIPKMIPAVMPALSSFSWLCMQRWPSEESIQRIPEATPMLFLSGLCDEVVPSAHMKELHRIAASPRPTTQDDQHSSLLTCSSRSSSREKIPVETPVDNMKSLSEHRSLQEFQSGQHNNTFLCEGYWSAVRQFLIQFNNSSSVNVA
ncbi:alpha/beta-hydrolase [Auriculariales sp. MPI-PUGE-AT-0066]|nr:alpha/beta-hydrolase [Auriculariales sp. MPI-PUGE-AT-0066]